MAWRVPLRRLALLVLAAVVVVGVAHADDGPTTPYLHLKLSGNAGDIQNLQKLDAALQRLSEGASGTEVISAETFGLQCDGVDGRAEANSAALVAAVAAVSTGGTILLPPGLCILDDPFRIAKSLTIASTGTTTFKVSGVNGIEVVYPDNGDGSTMVVTIRDVDITGRMAAGTCVDGAHDDEDCVMGSTTCCTGACAADGNDGNGCFPDVTTGYGLIVQADRDAGAGDGLAPIRLLVERMDITRVAEDGIFLIGAVNTTLRDITTTSVGGVGIRTIPGGATTLPLENGCVSCATGVVDNRLDHTTFDHITLIDSGLIIGNPAVSAINRSSIVSQVSRGAHSWSSISSVRPRGHGVVLQGGGPITINGYSTLNAGVVDEDTVGNTPLTGSADLFLNGSAISQHVNGVTVNGFFCRPGPFVNDSIALTRYCLKTGSTNVSGVTINGFWEEGGSLDTGSGSTTDIILSTFTTGVVINGATKHDVTNSQFCQGVSVLAVDGTTTCVDACCITLVDPAHAATVTIDNTQGRGGSLSSIPLLFAPIIDSTSPTQTGLLNSTTCDTAAESCAGLTLSPRLPAATTPDLVTGALALNPTVEVADPPAVAAGYACDDITSGTANACVFTTSATTAIYRGTFGQWVPTDTPPTCASGLEGAQYADNSLNAPCFCSGSAWCTAIGSCGSSTSCNTTTTSTTTSTTL